MKRVSSNKKFILNIVIVALIIAALAGAVYFLTIPEKEPNLSDSYTDDDKIKIFSAEVSDMREVYVTNEYGSYALRRVDSGWTLDGFEGISLDASMLDNLTGSFKNLTTTQRIEENPADLSVYGLDKPAAALRLVTTDGERTFYIGDETPDGNSYYFNTDTSSDVYLMESYVAAVVFLTARDYADIGSTIDADYITEIRISSPDGALHVVMDPEGEKDRYGLLSYWNITEPVERSASNSDVASVLSTPIAEMEDDISAILVDTAENRAETGVDSPQYTLELTSAGEDIVYRFGNTDGEYRYVLREGSGCIFRVDEVDCGFLYTQAYDVSEKYLAMIDIALLDSVKITYDGKTKLFTAVDADSDNARFYVDGKEVSGDEFRDFYQQIVAIPVGGEAIDPVYDDIVGTIEYTLTSGEKITLEFAPYEDRSYAVFVNGVGQYSILKKNIDRIFELTEEQ